MNEKFTKDDYALALRSKTLIPSAEELYSMINNPLYND